KHFQAGAIQTRIARICFSPAQPYGHRRSLHAGLEIQGLLVADRGRTRRQIGFVLNVISHPAQEGTPACPTHRDARDIGVPKPAVLRTAMRGHDEGTGWTSCGLLTRFAPCRCCLASRTTTRFAASFSGGYRAATTSVLMSAIAGRKRS